MRSLEDRPRPPADSEFAADPPAPVPDDLKSTLGYDLASTRAAIAPAPMAAEVTILEHLGLDLDARPDMDADRWQRVFPELMARFQLEDAGWRSVVFRLWVERVIHYTVHQVPLGYDAAMAYLEQTIRDFEETGS